MPLGCLPLSSLPCLVPFWNLCLLFDKLKNYVFGSFCINEFRAVTSQFHSAFDDFDVIISILKWYAVKSRKMNTSIVVTTAEKRFQCMGGFYRKRKTTWYPFWMMQNYFCFSQKLIEFMTVLLNLSGRLLCSLIFTHGVFRGCHYPPTHRVLSISTPDFSLQCIDRKFPLLVITREVMRSGLSISRYCKLLCRNVT